MHSGSRVVSYAFAYVLLEWLFFATKPSFLSASPLPDRLGALFVGALPFVLGALLLHGVLLLAARALARVAPRTSGFLRVAPRVVPALVTALLALILFDNFTHTVLGWSVAQARWTRPLYLLGLGVAFALHLRRSRAAASPGADGGRLGVAVAAGLLLCSGLALPLTRSESRPRLPKRPAKAAGTRLPNIVMFASDGVTASRTSAYGYARKTTPNLDRFLDRGVVVDNAFTNSAWTTGSVTSMLTGKYPATTKVLYPPYVLQGRDAYETLPRILRSLGYRSLQESVRYYADGPDLNWREAFDQANGREVELEGGARFTGAFQLPSLFVDRYVTRLAERLGHVLFLRPMVDRHALVTSPDAARVYGISDQSRMERVFAFIDRAPGPFFVHIHLMGTHCCTFVPEHPTFSAGTFASEAERSAAALDDTLLESDRHFGALMAHLQARRLLENTIVVYSSDHTSQWGFREQVPLIFFFPRGEHRGHLGGTAQLLDVAPTLLDFLGLPIPNWMEGHSLLRAPLPPGRPVFAINQLQKAHFLGPRDDDLAQVSATSVGPPTYGLSEVGMVVCQRWYDLRLADGDVSNGEIPTFRGACPEAQLPSKEQARDMMSAFLKGRGFSF